MRLSALIAILFLGCSACARVCCPPTSQATRARRFVLLQATPIEGKEGKPAELLVAAEVLTVRGGAIDGVLGRSHRVQGAASPTWVLHDATASSLLRSASRVDARPTLLAVDGQTATMFVGETLDDGSTYQGWNLELTPAITPEAVHMTLAYQHREAGLLVDSVVPTTLQAPPGQTLVIESLSHR